MNLIVQFFQLATIMIMKHEGFDFTKYLNVWE